LKAGSGRSLGMIAAIGMACSCLSISEPPRECDSKVLSRSERAATCRSPFELCSR